MTAEKVRVYRIDQEDAGLTEWREEDYLTKKEGGEAGTEEFSIFRRWGMGRTLDRTSQTKEGDTG